MESVKVFAPATVANVSCGFDILGFALNEPGDIIEVSPRSDHQLIVHNETDVKLPLEADKNVCSVAIKALLDRYETDLGLDIRILQKISPGSGVGSSSASAAGAVFAVNELLGKPFSPKELVPFAMEGERAATGVAHADNVAPALLGGFVLVRSYVPLDMIAIPYPEELFCAVVHPDIVVETKASRAVMPEQIPVQIAVKQWGNVAGLIAGLCTNNMPLIARSLEDHVAEPARSTLITGFDEVKQAALDADALGAGISGSGPSIFALCESEDIALQVANDMRSVFTNKGIDSNLYISPINSGGPKVL